MEVGGLLAVRATISNVQLHLEELGSKTKGNAWRTLLGRLTSPDFIL